MWPSPTAAAEIRVAGGRHRCRGHRRRGGGHLRRIRVGGEWSSPNPRWEGPSSPDPRGGVVGHLFHRPPCGAQPSLAATTARCCAPLPTAGLDREERIGGEEASQRDENIRLAGEERGELKIFELLRGK
ncbi:hypothetical protein [Oryza sativa Japonica Group]|uniref:Uncharacterized protein n=1 Tax=Oryza sativa subsp. japonica TaxID=39947 RepID=Q5VNY2_ORYSJ|nr:hypothetical protein [Oryza sativa Japonica Group]